MSSIGRYYARQMRREAAEARAASEWHDGDWYVSVKPRVLSRWRMWVKDADGPHCKFPRMTLTEQLALPFNERDFEDWGPYPEYADKPRKGTGDRVKHTRHTYTADTMVVGFACPTELAIWLDQQVAGTPGGRKTILVPLLLAYRDRMVRGEEGESMSK